MSSASQSLTEVLASVSTKKEDIGAMLQMEGSRRAKPSHYNILVPLKGGRSLAYNTVSGSFAVWSKEDVDIYERIQAEPTELWTRELRDFVYGGYIVSESTNELAEQEAKFQGARTDPARMTLTVAPTMACNFGCDYCFQGANKPTAQMSQLVQDSFIRYLEKHLGNPVQNLHIAWYGGEPLLGINIIDALSKKILELCKARGVGYSGFIVTNGYSLHREMAQKLVANGITSCQVTLDGAEEHHDQRRALLSGRATYEKIVQNMRSWIDDVPLAVSIRVNIDERNSDGIHTLLDDLAARGFGGRKNFSVYFAPVEAITEVCHSCNDVSMTKRNYAKLEVELYRYAFDRGLVPLPRPPVHLGHCQAIRPNGLLLLPNGDLHKCWDTVHDKGHRVGTIFEAHKVQESPKYKSWVEWSPFKNNTCRNCKILPSCTGACAHKFVNSDVTLGEAGALPCPSWKFNIGEKLLFRAEKSKVISQEDFPDHGFETSAEIVGRNHTYQSVAEALVPA